jgi:guanidinobutyrase
VRHFNVVTGAASFENLRIADLGDLPINPYGVADAHEDIYKGARHIFESGCIPMVLGGDHSLTYGMIRAAADKHGPVGLIDILQRSIPIRGAGTGG